jgi:hypothetical protein
VVGLVCTAGRGLRGGNITRGRGDFGLVIRLPMTTICGKSSALGAGYVIDKFKPTSSHERTLLATLSPLSQTGSFLCGIGEPGPYIHIIALGYIKGNPTKPLPVRAPTLAHPRTCVCASSKAEV